MCRREVPRKSELGPVRSGADTVHLPRRDECSLVTGSGWYTSSGARPGAPPVGEVYVLGISPSAQGRGLGRVLLDAGLKYLAQGPARDVILYVEQSNDTAVRLYERGGFVVDRRDIQFRSPSAT